TLSTTTTADVVGITMETDAGAWTTTSSGQAMYILTMPAGGPPAPFTQGMLNQLAAGGGSYILYPGLTPPWVTSVSIPQSLLNQQVVDTPSGTTWQDLVELYEVIGWSEVFAKGGLHTGALDPGEVRYTTAYDANIVAQAGHTVFTKSMNIDTRNKVISQSNLNAKTGLTFAATADGGNVVGSENIMLDGAGNYTAASDRMLCPFSAYPVDIIPAYCNIVQAGSKYDLTIGEVTTNANDRFVGTDATNPVALNYDINVKPYGSSQVMIPATGSAMAYIKAHIQEARTNTSKAEDLTYNEQSSAQGTITAFTKVIAYQSGKSLL
ncbi:MAG: hypothetical protein MUF37_07810, partial [Methanoregulaceae archaeon]|nr:hypothetical protein [Methanoregulaceae archaeon]